jgi:retinol-binding protein 3
MNRLSLALSVLACLALSPTDHPKAAEGGLDAQTRSGVVEAAAQALEENYFLPDIGKKMAQTLRENAAAHRYDGLATGNALGRQLTQDLYAIAHDRHIQVRYRDSRAPSPETGPDRFRQMMAWNNNGFREARRLEGNIGYLRVDSLVGTDIGADTANAAMGFLAGTGALIIDLRWNGGGTPEMVDLLCTYLFPAGERIHLNDFERAQEPRHIEFFTLPAVPGKRFTDKNVYILTSHFTFSAAEELAYDLKALKRATIVGEVTGGGANPGRTFPLPAEFSVFIPFGRAVNPITKTNWEGVGVQPDVAISADKALDLAHYLELKKVQARLPASGPERDEVSAKLRKLARQFPAMAAAPPQATMESPTTWKGYVSDQKCGRNVDAACNKKCLDEGVPPVLVVDGSGELLAVANPASLKPYPGAHVEITGKLSGGKLEVEKVSVLH